MVYYCILYIILSSYEFYQLLATSIPKKLNIGSFQKPHHANWIAWKAEYNKIYAQYVELLRFRVWLANLHEIKDHNIRFAQGREFYMKGLNKFSDLTVQELIRLLGSEVALASYYKKTDAIKLPIRDTPDSIDWSLHGSSSMSNFHALHANGWAFSAAEAVQAQIYKLTGNTTGPSMKEIVDCATTTNRALISMDAFSYIQEKGVTVDSFYGSKKFQRKMPCVRKEDSPKITIESYNMLEPGNEESLKVAVALIGPISVNILATGNFFFYESGIFYDPACQYKVGTTNHAVLVVGYGTDPAGGDFWIIQNNWGARWGENGFARISRNTVINCGVAAAAIYPVGVKLMEP